MAADRRRRANGRPSIGNAFVLVCSTDPVLSGVLARNLERRGFAVQQLHWEPCHAAPPANVPTRPDMVIADLDCAVADRWLAVTRLDRYFPEAPVIVLDYDRPDAGRLEAWRPYRFLRKPLGVRDLLSLVDELTAPVKGC
jgi:DNA-binding response OmpR family regulator